LSGWFSNKFERKNRKLLRADIISLLIIVLSDYLYWAVIFCYCINIMALTSVD